jgi:membrane-associated phospholipid phosphatase
MGQKILLTILFIFIATGVFAQGADLRLLEYINGPVNPNPDRTWRFVSEKSPYVDIAMPVSLIIAGFANDDNALKVKGYDAGASLIIAAGRSFVLKEIVQRERPFVTHPGEVTAKLNETGYSFPSNTTSLAFASATSLSIAIPKWYVIAPSFAYASAVGYSRLYLGVHYPSDVLGGAVVGVASSFLTFKAQQWLDRRRGHRIHNPL